MRFFIIFILFTSLSGEIVSQNYQPVDNLSSVKFTIKNFGLAVEGKFSGVKGAIKCNVTDIVSANFNVSIDVNSIHTGIEARDKHLRKEEYFNVAKFPTIHLVSKQVLITGVPETYTLVADITIKGITKEIRLPFKAKLQNEGILFTGDFKLNRRDFGVGGSSLVLSDNLIVSLSVIAKE